MTSSRSDALWSELRFRRKAIGRLYPGARFRSGRGGFTWDRSQPSAVQVLLGDSVIYDEELSLLTRAIDEEQQRTHPVPPLENKQEWPLHSHRLEQSNQMLDLLVSFACDDESWERDDVQNLYANMFGKQPLDRIVEALECPDEL